MVACGRYVSAVTTETLTGELRCGEWPLKSQGVEELWSLRHELSEKLKQRDAGGFLRVQGLTVDQLDEMTQQLEADPFGMGMEQFSVGAQFKFVAKIPPQRKQLAMKQAFRMAQQNAEEVAASADRSLGPLLTVAITDPAEYIISGYSYGYGQQQNQSRDKQNEISGPSPGPLKRVITTNVSFELAEE